MNEELISALAFQMTKHCSEMSEKHSLYYGLPYLCDYTDCYFRRNNLSCSKGFSEESWKEVFNSKDVV